MPVQDPAWRKRTRPCPFFSQGRCLFADSCNFLHDVKVRSSADQPVPTTRHHPIPPNPPSVVVDAPSPRSNTLAGPDCPAFPTQDSSRYSGLLSALSDVIGPPPAIPGDADSGSRTACPSTALPCSDAPSVSETVPASVVVDVESEQGTSESVEPSSTVLQSDGEGAVVTQMDSFLPEAHTSLVSESCPIPDPDDSFDGNPTSYFVEETMREPREDDDADQDLDNCEDENPTVVMSNRQSALSAFSGASLLDSPQNTAPTESSVASPPAVDLLSPVDMSAKLQPFPIPPLVSKIGRTDSIDSGYADGDSWASPHPFPRSPPRTFRSSMVFLPHLQPASHPSPALSVEGESHYPIEVIKEVESDTTSASIEDVAYTILDAYDGFHVEEKGEQEYPLRANVAIITADEAEEEVSAAMYNPRNGPEDLHPTNEYDLDSSIQSFFVSDDNLSFKTALSTQASYDDLNVSTVNPLSVSGYSASTSMLSYYDDASEFLEPPIVDSEAPSYLQRAGVTTGVPSRIDTTAIASDPEKCLLPEAAVNDNTSGGTDDLQGLGLEKVVTPQIPQAGVSHSNRHSPISASLMNTSHGPSLDKDVLGGLLGVDVQSKAVTPRERMSSVFSLDDHSPKASQPTNIPYGSSLVNDTFSSAPNNLQEFVPNHGLSPWKCPSSCKDVTPYIQEPVLESIASGVLDSDERSPKSCSSANDLDGPFSVEDVLIHSSKIHESGPCAPKEGSHSPSSNSGFTGDVQEFISEGVASRPCLESTPLAENSCMSSLIEDVLSSTFLGIDCSDLSSPEPASECVLGVVDQCLAEEALGPDENTESFESECNSFTQQLSFPLPPPFLPAEIVGNSTLADNEDGRTLSEESVASLEMENEVSEVCVVSQHAELPRIRSGSDLTEKAMSSQLPSLGSPDSITDFTSRRSRAASDITVKGKSSPMTVPGDISCAFESPPLLPNEPGRSDQAQSSCDRYLDNGTSVDQCAHPTHEDSVSASASSCIAEPSQDNHLPLPGFTRVALPCSDGKRSDSGSDSPMSETAFRPLLTGRRSFLRSSLAELIPKESPSSMKSSPIHQHARLQAREVGSTMVPLGFRRQKPQPATLPASELRQALRIRTDIVKEDSSRGCSSAHISSATRSPLVVKSLSAPPTGGLKELCLSSLINKRSSIFSTHSSSVASSILSSDHIFHSSTPQSPSVSSVSSFSCNSLLSSSREQIPEQVHHTRKRTSSNPLILQAANDVYFTPQSPSNRRDSRSVSAPTQPWRLSHYRAGSRNYSSADVTRRFSRRTSTLSLSYVVGEEPVIDEEDSTTTRPIQTKHADEQTHPGSVLAAPVHAIATPKPTLLFAIASDDVNQVHQVLESGEAGPNDSVGPQSALAFTLTNDKLMHKQEIVKALLAYGANPSALRNSTMNPVPHSENDDLSVAPPETTLEGMDPATRYFVNRADASHTRQTSQLIYRSFFRPLTRVRYDVIGQDWALEQLFRVLGMHSQKLAVAPIVVLLCGPSGHGKSLLARKFGSLLGIPTHTVNMTTLRSAHDIWQSYSMNPYEEPSSCTLTEFLIEHEGKRCVVVLDEIEKVEDQKVLWSLLMPWELGRCSSEAGKRHIDVRNVIWLGTSNIGHELVFEHHENRAEPDSRMSREDYLELRDVLRPRVSHCLGASLVSRVTTVLPFVPFTLDEKKAIAAEAVYALGSGASRMMSPQDVELVVMKALPGYRPGEGARSLHRAVSNILVDAI